MKQLFKPLLGFMAILVLSIGCKKGEMGPQGEKGPTGDAGVAGKNGPVGLKGLTGATGAQGDTGPNGQNGLNGQYYGYTTNWKSINWKLDPNSDDGLGSTYIFKFEIEEPQLYKERMDYSFFTMFINANKSLYTYRLTPRLSAYYRYIGGNLARVTYEVSEKKISFTSRVYSSQISGQAMQDSLNSDQTKFQFSIISTNL